MSSQPTWQPISMLGVVAKMIDGALNDSEEHFRTLKEARPGSLDDSTVSRIFKVYGDQRDDLGLYEEQIARWKREPTTTAQDDELERLSQQLVKLRAAVAGILALAEALKSQTIESILRTDDAALGLAVLLNSK
jgi:hypothetical protein